MNRIKEPLTTEEEFKARLDPKSCPRCHGKGHWSEKIPSKISGHSNWKTIYCNCPVALEIIPEQAPIFEVGRFKVMSLTKRKEFVKQILADEAAFEAEIFEAASQKLLRRSDDE